MIKAAFRCGYGRGMACSALEKRAGVSEVLNLLGKLGYGLLTYQGFEKLDDYSRGRAGIGYKSLLDENGNKWDPVIKGYKTVPEISNAVGMFLPLKSLLIGVPLSLGADFLASGRQRYANSRFNKTLTRLERSGINLNDPFSRKGRK